MGHRRLGQHLHPLIIEMLYGTTDTPRVYFRAKEYASQVELVAAGLCVGVLPRLGRPALPDTARVVPLRGAIPTRRFVAVYRKPTSRRPAIQRVVQALKDEIRPESRGTEAARGRPLHHPS